MDFGYLDVKSSTFLSLQVLDFNGQQTAGGEKNTYHLEPKPNHFAKKNLFFPREAISCAFTGARAGAGAGAGALGSCFPVLVIQS